MNNEEIRKIALAHGFNERMQPDGTTDLNAYVYAFARAMLEAGRSERLQQVPSFYAPGLRMPDEVVAAALVLRKFANNNNVRTFWHVAGIGDVRYASMTAQPATAETASVLRALIDFAVERTRHRYREDCPDLVDHDVRDPECPVCRAIVRAEKLLTDHTEEDIEMVSVPAGWRLVPAEPTEEMIEAGKEAMTCSIAVIPAFTCYRAMIAAAPKVKP